MKTKLTSKTTKPLSNIKNQGGWTFWSMLFNLSVVGFFTYIAMQLVPMYISNNNVVKAMEGSVDGENLKTLKHNKVSSKMSRQLSIDGDSALLDFRKDVVITRDRNIFTLAVSYQREVPISSSMALVVSFNPVLECNFSGSCTKQ